MKGIRIRWKAIGPAIGVIGGILASPQVTAVLPDKWSHVIIGLSAVAAIFTPAVATNRPPSDAPINEPPPTGKGW